MNKTYKKNRHGKKKTLKKRVGGVDLVKKCKSTYVTTSVKRKTSEAKKIYDRDVKLARKNIKDKTNLKKSIKDIEELTEHNIVDTANSLKYTTPLKYKGLEKENVALIINNPSEKNQHEIYVGITRTKQNLKIYIII